MQVKGKESTATIASPGAACSFCDSGSMVEIIDFGDVALAGGFLTADEFEGEKKFRLTLYFCQTCYAMQVRDVVEPSILFENYFYFSSAIRSLKEHFVDYATEVVSRFLDPAKATVVEIGCNDGILLKPIADQGVRTVIGVDPATNIVQAIDDERVTVVNDFFSRELAVDLVGKHGRADMIVANNVYAHIPDIQGVTAGICDLLKGDGIFIFEVHYLGKIVHGIQYDMIYHEHMYYYCLLALANHFARFGMTIFDVKPISIHGGSMRYYVCKQGSKYAGQISPRVSLLQSEELSHGFNKAETFTRFASAVADRKARLMSLLARLKEHGRSVAGYGASGRANTIMQYCGIGREHLLYMIDDAPAKAGFYTPGSHLPIRSNAALVDTRPDYLLVFAWTYFNEIAEKCRDYLDGGGALITPLPDVRLVLHPVHDGIL